MQPIADMWRTLAPSKAAALRCQAEESDLRLAHLWHHISEYPGLRAVKDNWQKAWGSQRL